MAKTREDRIERLTGTCRHFNGLQYGRCNADVSYESVMVSTGKPPVALPCLKHRHTAPTHCDKCQFLTREEAEAEENAMVAFCQNVDDARAAIVVHTGGNRGVSGRMTCPICGGENALGYSVSGYNGHIHAKCSTPGCVCWME